MDSFARAMRNKEYWHAKVWCVKMNERSDGWFVLTKLIN